MQKTIQFKDVSIYTESFGNDKNPAILLIMGSASSLIWWDIEFCNKLVDKGYFVIRYDNRDTGKSTSYPVGKPGYTFEEMSDDAIEILDAYHIEKAIMLANVGFNPMNNGDIIIINVPVLTEERRRELSKQAKVATEFAKVSIRNGRREAMSEIKKAESSEDEKTTAEASIQKLTDAFIAEVDNHFKIKDQEIMKV